MHHEHPELIKDQYWDEVFPTELPHTVASQAFKGRVPQPSTANIAVSNSDADYFEPSSVKVTDVSQSLVLQPYIQSPVIVHSETG